MDITVTPAELTKLVTDHIIKSGVDLANKSVKIKFKGGRIYDSYAIVTVTNDVEESSIKPSAGTGIGFDLDTSPIITQVKTPESPAPTEETVEVEGDLIQDSPEVLSPFGEQPAQSLNAGLFGSPDELSTDTQTDINISDVDQVIGQPTTRLFP